MDRDMNSTPQSYAATNAIPGLSICSSVEEFLEMIESDSALTIGRTRAILQPSRLGAGGTSLVCSFVRQIGTGFVEIFRPFPGSFVTLSEGICNETIRFSSSDPDFVPMEEHYVCRLVDAGSCTIRINGSEYTVGPGDCLIYKFSSDHDIEFSLKGGSYHRYASFFFSEQGVQHSVRYLGVPAPDIFRALALSEIKGFPLGIDKQTVRAFTASIWDTRIEGVFQGALARLKLSELFCMLHTRRRTNDETYVNGPTVSEARRLELARSLLADQRITRLKLSELARHVGLNRRKLTEGFKYQYGKTVGEYRKECAMNSAFKLLCSNECSVEEAANKVGYAHLSSFSRAFRTHFGQPPSSVAKDLPQ